MQKDLLSKVFDSQLSETKRKSALKWAALNVFFLSMVLGDLLLTDKYSRESLTFYYIELLASGILSLSFITNIITFIYHSFSDKIVCENETQRILLNLGNNCSIKEPVKVQKPQENLNETINIQSLSFQTYSERELIKPS